MTDRPFAELIADPAAIEAFVAAANGQTDRLLGGPGRAADAAIVRDLLEAPDVLRGLTRREGALYTYRQTAANPRGLWLRLPEGVDPAPQGPWETVFDLDAFCAAEGRVWVWRGAVTSARAPGRVLLRLSLDGSDLTRHLEFDLAAKAPVQGGFDLPPGRGSAVWAGPDALLWSSAEAGDATQAGWPGTLRRLVRGQAPEAAAEVFRSDPANLLCSGWITRAGGAVEIEARLVMPAIGMTEVTLLRPGRAPLVLPNPADTEVEFCHSHCAWIAQAKGAHPAGTLVLQALDGGAARVLFTPGPGRAAAAPLFAAGWLIWTETDWLVPRLLALDLSDPGAQPVEIAPPVPAETLAVGFFDADPDAGDGTLVLHLSGFLTPPQQWLFDLSQGVRPVFRRLYALPARFDAAGCEVRLLRAISADGTEVPYHLVLPAGAAGRGDLPVLQYGYGGFGVALSPWYDAITGKLWIERGGAFVMAYIRGGAELGPDWHLSAKGAGRRRAYDDFAAVARDLVARGLTVPSRIACHGGSNGGLLCGVMLVQYPQDFGAVWASVGVHDLLGFADFPAGRGWIDEYGDPADPQAAAWLRQWSPLHGIPAADPARPLPPALIDTSHHDDRVDPSHSRRFAAALQAAGHGSLFYQHQGGHGGGGASTEKAAEQALGFAFLRHALGLQAPAASAAADPAPMRGVAATPRT